MRESVKRVSTVLVVQCFFVVDRKYFLGLVPTIFKHVIWSMYDTLNELRYYSLWFSKSQLQKFSLYFKGLCS